MAKSASILPGVAQADAAMALQSNIDSTAQERAGKIKKRQEIVRSQHSAAALAPKGWLDEGPTATITTFHPPSLSFLTILRSQVPVPFREVIEVVAADI